MNIATSIAARVCVLGVLAALTGRAAADRVLIADSAVDFSGAQGSNGWSYGWYDAADIAIEPGSVSVDAAEFRAFDAYSPDEGWSAARSGRRTSDGRREPDSGSSARAEAIFLHPYASLATRSGSGVTRQEQWAVRRWTSDFSGEILLSGFIAHNGVPLGNGTEAHVLVDGVSVYSRDLAPGDTTGAEFLLELSVEPGSRIDLAVDAKGDPMADGTEFTASVTLVAPAFADEQAFAETDAALERDLTQLNDALDDEHYLFRKRFNIDRPGTAFFQKALSDYTLGRAGADFDRDGRLSAGDLALIVGLSNSAPHLGELSRVESEGAEWLLAILAEHGLLLADEGRRVPARGSLDAPLLARGLLGPREIEYQLTPIEPICLSNRAAAMLIYERPALAELAIGTLGLSPCRFERCRRGDLTGSQQGRVLIYRNGIADGYELSEGCIQTLGDYDPETGEWVGPNNGLLNGKYAFTTVFSIDEYGDFPFDQWANIEDFHAGDNDFRLDPFCYDAPDADHLPCAGANQREAVQWSAQSHIYYFIDDFRNRFFNPIADSIGFDDETYTNVMHRQFRPDLDLGAPPALRRPLISTDEATYFGPFGTIGFNGIQNYLSTATLTRGPYSPITHLPPLALSFDPGAHAGEYAGLMAYWVLGDSRGFPPEMWWYQQWQQTVVAALNDGSTAWTAYLVGGRHPEVYRSYFKSLRIRVARAGERACGGTNYSCDKGPSVRNVMMFDPDLTNQDSVFPFNMPSYSDGTSFDGVDGPTNSDIAAMYFAAIFYDISNEAGLGDVKANQIFWRTLYTIDDAFNLNMNAYGEKVMDAVRFLWPDGNGGSRYEDDVADVLTSRGIYVERGNGDADGDGDVDFRDNLPQAIGDYAAGTLEKNSTRRFGSSHPDVQPSILNYGQVNWYDNRYIHHEAAGYVAYQLHKHSKYGPCDELRLTDGTFTDKFYNNDGSFYAVLSDRDLGNKIVLVPGNDVRFQRYRKRCDNEAEGYYTEDVRPFGFRAIQAISNGFSIRVASNAERPNFKHYEVSLVDPSVATLGESTYLVEYVDHEGTAQATELAASTETYSFWTRKNEPFTLRITRNRGDGDTIEFRERGNDFDRDNGNAFILDLR